MEDHNWGNNGVVMSESIEMENAVGSARIQSGRSTHGTRGTRGPF
jgi:hypothetical protein